MYEIYPNTIIKKILDDKIILVEQSLGIYHIYPKYSDRHVSVKIENQDLMPQNAFPFLCMYVCSFPLL